MKPLSFFQSMTSRIVLILVSGVFVSALLTLGLALGERQRMISQFRDFHAAERAAQFIQWLETIQPALREHYLAAASGVGMHAELAGAVEEVKEEKSELAALLEKRLPAGYEVASAPAHASDCPPPARPRPQRALREPPLPCEAFLIRLQDGTRVHMAVVTPRPPPLVPRPDFLGYGIAFLCSIGLLAALVARMTMHPLKQLAQAAAELGNDIERPPLPERGATEIRQAATAFNAMQARIRHHIKQRAHILAAITHDLQTPLTRLRLRLEKVSDAELRDKLVNDLAAMQSMVREGLDLARSLDSAEPLQLLDLDSLVDSVCIDASDAGQDVALSGKTGISLKARPTALKRCLVNLVDNAVKYGHRAEVQAGTEQGFAVIRIRDAGPGIPENELEKVFDPFYRLEHSRSRHTGGTGLGLTIARNIAEQHGGTITLRNRVEGGLEVTLALPSPG